MAQASGAVVAYRDVEGGRQQYRARLPLVEPASPERLVFTHAGGPDVIIQAVTLFDERTGMFLALTPSDRGRFQRVHSGDVKVYENLDVLPRAYLVHEVIPATDGDDALSLVLAGEFDPRQSAVVEGGLPLQETGDGLAELIEYAGERVVVRTSGEADGFLVLSDAYYPGWTATVDGEPTPVYPANHLLRGVYVPAGDHTVVFRFAPDSWRHGVWVSVAGLLAALGVWAWAMLRRPTM